MNFEFFEFIEKFGKPIVFVDNYPFKDNNYPQNVTFVGVNSSDGGCLAAKAVLKISSNNPINNILVLASNTQVARQNKFRDFLNERLPKCKVYIEDGGRFNREAACRLTFKYLRASSDINEPYNVIFCTSDSMTLGCMDAINSFKKTNKLKKLFVIGYDGIDTTKRLADDSDSPLEYIVIQDSYNIAVASVEKLKKLIKGEALNGPFWIEPTLYPTGINKD